MLNLARLVTPTRALGLLLGWSSFLNGISGTGRPATPAGSTSYTLVVKIAVSVPDALFERAEEFAARLGLKRSQLYARAVEEFLLAHDEDAVTAALDALADEAKSSEAEESGRAVGRALIGGGDWEW